MQKKESSLEFFKNAIISTIKSISKKNDCEIKFGKSTNQTNSEKLVNLPEINKLENINDFLLLRAKADSEALRLKHSNKDIFELHKPKGEISQKLYQIAEKIRYEKIGSEDFLGIRKNLQNEKVRQNLEKYIFSKFSIKINGKPISINLAQLIFETAERLEEDLFICEFEAFDISKIKSIKVSNSILTERFDSQTNIVFIIANGKRETLNLDRKISQGEITYD